MLTKKQSEVLGYIGRYIARNHGVGPTRREIMRELGFTSAGVVQEIVDRLVERGALVRLRRRNRAIMLPNSMQLVQRQCGVTSGEYHKFNDELKELEPWASVA